MAACVLALMYVSSCELVHGVTWPLVRHSISACAFTTTLWIVFTTTLWIVGESGPR